MPELPEVETTRRGILPHCKDQSIVKAIVHNRKLRWPVASSLTNTLYSQGILDVGRRGKYLLFNMSRGTLILHLGMSGSLRISKLDEQTQQHDHIELALSNNKIIRFNDPRRFGSVHWTSQPCGKHKLLRSLGPEPLGENFSANYLYNVSRNRKVSVKNFIMNSRIVVGVGNIYASESLYYAGIHPKRAAANISLRRYEKLTTCIQNVLSSAIESGGSTLNDFSKPDGTPGYFQHHFAVYGKTGEPCGTCGQSIKQISLGQRSTFYCGKCQH